MKAVLLALLSALTFAPRQNLHAQAFPSKPGRILVGVSAGGGVDVASRVIAGKLTEYWGQQVVIENRAGATGVIGADMVAKAPPDGYLIVMGVNGPITTPASR